MPGSENGRKFGNGAPCGNGGRRNREDISRELRVPVELRPSDRSRATNRAKGTYFLRRTELLNLSRFPRNKDSYPPIGSTKKVGIFDPFRLIDVRSTCPFSRSKLFNISRS